MTGDPVPALFLTLWWGMMGLCFGSFANVVIARLPYGEGVTGRSRCPHCGMKLRAFPDLVPVFSWILLNGRCRGCQGPIRFRYPAIELLTGILFLLAVRRHPVSPGEIAWTSFWLAYLLIVAAIDLETRLILNKMTYPGVLLAIAGRIFLFDAPLGSLLESPLFGAWAAAAGLYLLGWIGRMIFRKEAMGLGDVKLMAVLGGLLGIEGAFWAFLSGSILGGVVSLVLLLAGRVELRGTVAYGPFLSIGGMLVLLGWHGWI